jgi:hypothetical protein
MSPRFNAAEEPVDPALDWVDRALLRDAADHAGEYIPDSGFTARVMQALPPSGDALPAWRRPAVTLLWVIAGALLAVSLPGVAVDVARAAYTLFSARPFSLSTLAVTLVAIGVCTWTAAAFALRRD